MSDIHKVEKNIGSVLSSAYNFSKDKEVKSLTMYTYTQQLQNHDGYKAKRVQWDHLKEIMLIKGDCSSQQIIFYWAQLYEVVTKVTD